MRYRDSVREAKQWAMTEAGYRDDLPSDEKKKVLAKVEELMEEVENEMRFVEYEEEEVYAKHDRKYRRNMDDAA